MKSGLLPPKFMLKTSLRALSVDICTAAGLGLAGDVICQRLEGTDPISLRRLTAVTVYDGLYIGGVLHFLYKLYSPATSAAAHILVSSAPLRKRLLGQTSFSHALGCAAVDNVHCALIYLPTFFVGVGLLQGEGFDSAV